MNTDNIHWKCNSLFLNLICIRDAIYKEQRIIRHKLWIAILQMLMKLNFFAYIMRNKLRELELLAVGTINVGKKIWQQSFVGRQYRSRYTLIRQIYRTLENCIR